MKYKKCIVSVSYFVMCFAKTFAKYPQNVKYEKCIAPYRFSHFTDILRVFSQNTLQNKKHPLYTLHLLWEFHIHAKNKLWNIFDVLQECHPGAKWCRTQIKWHELLPIHFLFFTFCLAGYTLIAKYTKTIAKCEKKEVYNGLFRVTFFAFCILLWDVIVRKVKGFDHAVHELLIVIRNWM